MTRWSTHRSGGGKRGWLAALLATAERPAEPHPSRVEADADRVASTTREVAALQSELEERLAAASATAARLDAAARMLMDQDALRYPALPDGDTAGPSDLPSPATRPD